MRPRTTGQCTNEDFAQQFSCDQARIARIKCLWQNALVRSRHLLLDYPLQRFLRSVPQLGVHLTPSFVTKPPSGGIMKGKIALNFAAFLVISLSLSAATIPSGT